MLFMAGLGALAAAVPVPLAGASVPELGSGRAPAPAAPSAGAPAVTYVFEDDFNGPAGQGPDLTKWTVWDWDEDVYPPLEGHYVARNVFLDGNSNLVLRATQEGFPSQFYSGKIHSNWKGGIGYTWEARMKLNCLTTGCWPAYWTVNEDPLPDGEVDVMEWYGNGDWPAGTTVHARSDGKTWEGLSIPGLVDGAWHTWRMRWDEDGFQFWRDYVDGAKPYFSVPAKPIHGVWPFNQPGYLMSVVFNLAVGGPGAGDPRLGNFPAEMLIDYIRVW